MRASDAAWAVPTADAFPLTPELQRLAEAVGKEGGRPVLVGGWVRDCQLGIPHSKDFDLEVFGMDPDHLKGILSRFGPVHTVGRHFGVLKLTTRQGEYDVSVPRRESKTGKGHRGFWVTPDPTMTFEQAAARRDFTINAMGFSLIDQGFEDPFRGYADLRAGLLRHVGPAFGEDPLRVLRAMQFAGRFNLAIVPETIAICTQQHLEELARERLW
jgi:tRNA nucleotidyltransferase (CCA-adding enzyme)